MFDYGEKIIDLGTARSSETTTSTIVIPKGTYPTEPSSTCRSMQSPTWTSDSGHLKGPAHPKHLDGKREWLTVQYIDHFTLSHGGVLDGQGAIAYTDEFIKGFKSNIKLPNVSPKFNKYI